VEAQEGVHTVRATTDRLDWCVLQWSHLCKKLLSLAVVPQLRVEKAGQVLGARVQPHVMHVLLQQCVCLHLVQALGTGVESGTEV
jgi:hypothetical protein